MSGGRWGYSHFRLENIVDDIADDQSTKKRFPILTALMRECGYAMSRRIKELDYDISGDNQIPDDSKFERESIIELLRIVMEASPDDLFPRGKWATIQAVLERGNI